MSMDQRLSDARRALAADPADDDAREALARSLERSGDVVGAAELRAGPGEPRAVLAYLTALCEAERAADALAVFAEQAPRLARLYLLRGETDEERSRARKEVVHALYSSRHKMLSAPEGHQVAYRSSWVPTEREDCGGSSGQGFSNAIDHCRSRSHCANLVAAALEGRDVPTDALRVVYSRALGWWWSSGPSGQTFTAPVPEPFKSMILRPFAIRSDSLWQTVQNHVEARREQD